MRSYFGFIILALFIPILAFTIKGFYHEWTQYTPLQPFLDKKVNVNHISLPEMSYITVADGTVISEITNGEKRIPLTYDEIPKLSKDVFITVEDQSITKELI